jgi:hypothetical protein
VKIFISWSGALSEKIALALREWIPLVIQSVDIVISMEIRKGARWGIELAKALEDTSFGIICVTKSNINAPWLAFEAGSISKTVNSSYVAPILVDLPRSELRGPLEQFQSVLLEKEDLRRLVAGINESATTKSLPDGRINQIFEKWYPDLERQFTDILSDVSIANKNEGATGAMAIEANNIIEHLYEETTRNSHLLQDKWAEVNELTRSVDYLSRKLDTTITTTENFIKTKPSAGMMRSSYVFEISHKSPLYIKNYAGLKVVLSFFKSDYPWIYDAGLEVISLCRSRSSATDRSNAIGQFKEMVEFTFRHPLMRDVYKMDEHELGTGLRLVQIFDDVLTGDANEK